jgi:hypothetical protein
MAEVTQERRGNVLITRYSGALSLAKMLIQSKCLFLDPNKRNGLIGAVADLTHITKITLDAPTADEFASSQGFDGINDFSYRVGVVTKSARIHGLTEGFISYHYSRFVDKFEFFKTIEDACNWVEAIG